MPSQLFPRHSGFFLLEQHSLRGYDGNGMRGRLLLISCQKILVHFLPPRPHPEAAHRQLLNNLGGLGI